MTVTGEIRHPAVRRQARGVRVGFLALICLAPTASATAQSVITLARPDATLAEEFSLIKGVRELNDGRVLLTDWIEERLVLADFTKKTITNRGRTGAGPQEFHLPERLLPFRGDSTILVDRANNRLPVLDREGRITRILSVTNPSATYPSGVDAQGRLYFSIPPWNTEKPLPADSIELARLTPPTNSVEIVGRMKGSTHPPTNGPVLHARIPMVVFARQDSWAIAPSGRIAIVRGGNYSVEYHDGGKVVRGPSNAYPPIRVTDAERTAYARQFTLNSPMSGKGEGGTLGHTPNEFLTPARIAELVKASSWADVLPYFRPGDVRFDAADRLWVGRSTATGEPLRYDVFNPAGARIATLELPKNRRLSALGKAHLYLIATSPDGLETLERYMLPQLR
jgi:hypothetical protein